MKRKRLPTVVFSPNGRVGTSRRTKSRQILILPEKRQVHPKAF